jgi:hypothetical protein
MLGAAMTRVGEPGSSAAADGAAGVRLERLTVAPGELVRGVVPGCEVPTEVALVRVESSPTGAARLTLVRTTAQPSLDGFFAIEVPQGAPPTSAGKRCELAYSVEARPPETRPASRRRAQLIVPAGECAVREPGALGEARAVAHHAARRFHLELSDASLVGGGHIRGRIHRHAEALAGGIAVVARCREAWATANTAAFVGPHVAAPWHETTLWESEVALDPLDAVNWRPFAFEVPPGLPPAVEARTIAWRYEIEARRSRRFALDERAFATPLQYIAVPTV